LAPPVEGGEEIKNTPIYSLSPRGEGYQYVPSPLGERVRVRGLE